MGKNSVAKATKLILDIMFFAGIVVIASLPWSIGLAGRRYDGLYSVYYWPMVVLFAAEGICAELILAKLRRMMGTVLRRDCFVMDNVASLRSMGIVSFIIAALYIVKMFLIPSPAAVVVVLTFFIAGLFSRVLARVFAEAVRYKEENDLTI